MATEKADKLLAKSRMLLYSPATLRIRVSRTVLWWKYKGDRAEGWVRSGMRRMVPLNGERGEKRKGKDWKGANWCGKR